MPPNASFPPATAPYKSLQYRYYDAFRCAAEACEDNCCNGWRVTIDKATYEKYAQCADPVLQPRFQEFVTINTESTNENSYAMIRLEGTRCPFVSDSLCSIQKRLGEDHLSKTCATFPRVINVVGDLIERSLDLSCPEAARLALTDPTPAQLCLTQSDNLRTEGGRQSQPRSMSRYAPEARDLILSILQNRKYPVSKRLILVGHVCDKLNEIVNAGTEDTTPEVIEGFTCAIDSGLFDAHLNECTADPVRQLGVVLELIVARIGLDFTPQRYLNLHQEFMQGIGLTVESTIEELGERYADAYRLYYAPFMAEHEHMMEHYLVNYAFKTMLPFGSQATNRLLGLDCVLNPIAAQYILMASYYAITKAVAIGLAGKYKAEFNSEHVIRVVQSCSRMLEHCTAYPTRVIELLATKGITAAAGMAILTQN